MLMSALVLLIIIVHCKLYIVNSIEKREQAMHYPHIPDKTNP